ncbi:hypothetical protein [Limibacillus sp. MBR-115]|jgi:hypothetical protein|uniref:hypothetical protein n=1 Tax=Limibacillus sp. MBR-115 TaxID=3156465 RepID=UPI003399DAE3
MRYSVTYQYRPKDSSRPLDYGQSVEISSDGKDLILLPNIGDHVSFPDADEIRGIVENRLFHYPEMGEAEDVCVINIVVTKSEEDWGKLIKE